MRTAIEDVRRFNRFYTRQIGLLREHLTDSPFSLAEARVLYELAHGTVATAADLSRMLGMDRAHLSRMLARFRSRGLLTSSASPGHGRRQLLALTEAGRAAFAELDRRAIEQVEQLLDPLDARRARKLTEAMRGIEALLDGARADGEQADGEQADGEQADGEQAAAKPAVVLRAPRVGDLGWVIHRQCVLYHEEYGWDWTYEGLAASILGPFVAGFDPAREQAWIAELDGAVVGSVFLMRSDAPDVGKLRLLYVEPKARGLGIGRALVEACIGRAREIGYRRLTLWTNDVLTAARRIYETAGFRLVAEERHRSFGHDLNGQTWTLDL